MDTFIVRKNSWHYRLAMVYGFKDYIETDICAYMRQVLVGGIFAACLAGLVGLVVGSLADAIIYLVIQATTDQFLGELTGFGAFGMLMIFASVLTAIIVGVVKGLKALYGGLVSTVPRVTVPTPGFVETAYRSFKGKFCINVELEQDEH